MVWDLIEDLDFGVKNQAFVAMWGDVQRQAGWERT